MLSYGIHAVVALLAITNPLGAAPLFASITEGMTGAQRRRAVVWACITVGLILGGAAISGAMILKLFGVGLDAFRFGGGLVIVLMGLEMLRGQTSAIHRSPDDESDEEDRIFVPFAMPLVAGPGSITTAITLSAGSTEHDSVSITLLAVLVTVGVLGVTLIFSGAVVGRFGGRSLRLLTRFMGMILLAIGAQFLLAGYAGFMHGAGAETPALHQH